MRILAGERVASGALFRALAQKAVVVVIAGAAAAVALVVSVVPSAFAFAFAFVVAPRAVTVAPQRMR